MKQQSLQSHWSSVVICTLEVVVVVWAWGRSVKGTSPSSSSLYYCYNYYQFVVLVAREGNRMDGRL